MDATAFFLLSLALTLIAVGSARVLSFFIDRRAAQPRADLRAAQLVMSARLSARRGGAL